MPKQSATTPTGVEAKLDEILVHLRNLDKRDRLRTWGGTIKGILSLIPLIVFVWSLWYFYAHGDELLSQIATEAAKAAAAATQKSTEGFMDQFKNFMPQ